VALPLLGELMGKGLGHVAALAHGLAAAAHKSGGALNAQAEADEWTGARVGGAAAGSAAAALPSAP